MDVTQISIAATAGLVLSLVFSWVPYLKDWYDALTPTPKKLVMLAALLLTTVGLIAYRCRADGACYGVNWETYLTAFIAALMANQSAASITPLSPERRAVRKAAFERHMGVSPSPTPISDATKHYPPYQPNG